MFLAVDPGPIQSAYVAMNGGIPIKHGLIPNNEMLALVHEDQGQSDLVIEMIASYGMAVGSEVFETCVYIGRFMQASIVRPHRMFRSEIKLHLCGTMKAKDSNIRQALVDRYGPGKDRAVGVKKSPGPLYGVRADVWAALAVGVTWHDKHAKDA